MNLLEKIAGLEEMISNSPMCRLNHETQNLFAKLEYTNLNGSIKDRPALYMLKSAIENNRITEKSVIIESSSGNFGIALAVFCKKLGINFIPVVDPNITKEKEKILEALSYRVVKVIERDDTGGYLITRLKKVGELLNEVPFSYNLNQYENIDNYLSYFHTIGEEIAQRFSKLHFAFISVSTGGTITGVSLKLKQRFPEINIVAVDVEGSMIFCDQLKRRRLSGLGAGIRTAFFDKALIDDVMILTETEIINGCNQLLSEQGIFAGASSGAAYLAAKMMLKKCDMNDLNAVIICPDGGSAYLDTIYNKEAIA